MSTQELRVGPELDGQRLDMALKALKPQLGRRGRRRLAEQGCVLLNGRPARAASKVACGDVLTLHEAVPSPQGYIGPVPRLLSAEQSYAYIYKPAGLHTTAVAGGGTSVEDFLPQVLAPVLTPAGKTGTDAVQLLQRLDCGTSGVLCAALTPEAAALFRKAEMAGQCCKRYVALLCGHLEAPCIARQSLNTARRRRTRVLRPEAPVLRWTQFFPLAHVDGPLAAELLKALNTGREAGGAVWPVPAQAEHGSGAGMADGPLTGPEYGPVPHDQHQSRHGLKLTLAGCSIQCGARHQIRAHAAALGHPLWGDSLYGAEAFSRQAADGYSPASFGSEQGMAGRPLTEFRESDQPQSIYSAGENLPRARTTAAARDGVQTGFFLHHGGLHFPHGSCVIMPPWSMPPTLSAPWAERIRKWLESGLVCVI